MYCEGALAKHVTSVNAGGVTTGVDSHCPCGIVQETVVSRDPNNLFTEEGNSAIIGRAIMAPSAVDNTKQAELGSLKLEYLMERPPRTREEALTIRDDAMGNPLYRGTLVSEDDEAICIYIPIATVKAGVKVRKRERGPTSDARDHSGASLFDTGALSKRVASALQRVEH